jgi:hypothetical protein
MTTPQRHHAHASSSPELSDALSDGDSPLSAAFAPGYSPKLGSMGAAAAGAQFSSPALETHAHVDRARLDPATDDFWLHAIRSGSMRRCRMKMMKVFLKARKLKSSGSRLKLVQRIESFFSSSPHTGAASAAAAPSSDPNSAQIRNIESLPRADIINGLLSGLVSSAEQLELTPDERREVFM